MGGWAVGGCWSRHIGLGGSESRHIGGYAAKARPDPPRQPPASRHILSYSLHTHRPHNNPTPPSDPAPPATTTSRHPSPSRFPQHRPSSQLTRTLLISIESAPIAIAIFIPSPVPHTPLVVGKRSRSGRCSASSELPLRSFAKPPVARTVWGARSSSSAPEASEYLEAGGFGVPKAGGFGVSEAAPGGVGQEAHGLEGTSLPASP